MLVKLTEPRFAAVKGLLLDPSCSGSGTAHSRMDHLLQSTQHEENSAEDADGRVAALAAFQASLSLFCLGMLMHFQLDKLSCWELCEPSLAAIDVTGLPLNVTAWLCRRRRCGMLSPSQACSAWCIPLALSISKRMKMLSRQCFQRLRNWGLSCIMLCQPGPVVACLCFKAPRS